MRAWLPFAALATVREGLREGRSGRADGETLVASLVESFDLDCWTNACHGIALECAASDTVCGKHLACGMSPHECFGSTTLSDLSPIESDLFQCGKEHRCAESHAPSSFVGSTENEAPVNFEAFLTGMEEKAATYLRNVGHTFYNALVARAKDQADDPDPTKKLDELRDMLKSGKLHVGEEKELDGMLHKIDLIEVGLQSSKGTEEEKAVLRNYILPHLSLIIQYANNPPHDVAENEKQPTSSLIAMKNGDGLAMQKQAARLPDSLVQLIKGLGTKHADLAKDARRFDESFEDGYGKAREDFGLPARGMRAASGAGSLVESSAKPAYAGTAAMSAVVDKIAAYNAKLSRDFPNLPGAGAAASE